MKEGLKIARYPSIHMLGESEPNCDEVSTLGRLRNAENLRPK
jgi:hypothetical protein